MKNHILIGMPGVGKSTLGVLLAKKLAWDFLDTDLVLQAQHQQPLQALIHEHGLEGFCELEKQCLCQLECDQTVVATGGSVIYYPEAMQHLQSLGTLIYLQLPLDELIPRLGDFSERGVVLPAGYTLQDLYEERVGLYEKYASLTLNCSQLSHDDACNALHQAVT